MCAQDFIQDPLDTLFVVVQSRPKVRAHLERPALRETIAL